MLEDKIRVNPFFKVQSSKITVWKVRKLNDLDFSPEASERPETMEAANVVHLEALILPCHCCLEL